VNVTYSRHLADWLIDEQVSLAITTYQANKLLLVGVQPNGRIGVFQRTFPRCMGLWSDGQTIWMASQFQLWRFENVLANGAMDNGYDRLYVPRHGYVTGDLDVHDLAVNGEGQPVFVNTLFSCLATLDDRYSFRPLWQPPFISRLAAEDRCHLNGLAMESDMPRYVTAAGQSDVGDGWRDRRIDGGCVLDVESGEVVADTLCMPHSPRLAGGRLWLVEAGTGRLGHVDRTSGRFEPVAFCPGFPRGLAIVGTHAVVGLSRPRHEPTFGGLPLEKTLAQKKAEARCGVQVVDLTTGASPHWLRIDGDSSGPIDELYDVIVLPNVRRPKALGFQSDEIRHQVWFEEAPGQPRQWSAGTKPAAPAEGVRS